MRMKNWMTKNDWNWKKTKQQQQNWNWMMSWMKKKNLSWKMRRKN
jgi:hypothetical protein